MKYEILVILLYWHLFEKGNQKRTKNEIVKSSIHKVSQ